MPTVRNECRSVVLVAILPLFAAQRAALMSKWQLLGQSQIFISWSAATNVRQHRCGGAARKPPGYSAAPAQTHSGLGAGAELLPFVFCSVSCFH